MPIKFTCPHCRVSMTIPDTFAGKRAKCPACGNPITIPGEPAGDAPDKTVSRELGDWYRKMTGEGAAAPRSALDELHRDTEVDVSEVVTRWDEEEDDDSWTHESEPAAAPPRRRSAPPPPRRRRPPADEEEDSGANMLLIGGGIAFLLLIVVVVVVLTKGSSPAPQQTPAGPNAALSAAPAATQTAPAQTPPAAASPTPTPSPTVEKTPSPEELAKRNLAYGDDAYGRFDYAKAADYYSKYLEFDPKDAGVWKKLIECYQKLGRNDKALEAVDKAVENLGADAELLRLRVDLQVELEKLDAAFQTYEQLLEKLTDRDDRMNLLLEMFNMALTYGSDKPSKEYLDKAWMYLQKLKEYIDSDEFEDYKTTLKEAYESAGFNAPF